MTFLALSQLRECCYFEAACIQRCSNGPPTTTGTRGAFNQSLSPSTFHLNQSLALSFTLAVSFTGPSREVAQVSLPSESVNL